MIFFFTASESVGGRGEYPDVSEGGDSGGCVRVYVCVCVCFYSLFYPA